MSLNNWSPINNFSSSSLTMHNFDQNSVVYVDDSLIDQNTRKRRAIEVSIPLKDPARFKEFG